MRALGLVLVATAFAVVAPNAMAANGTITVTGTETRDEVHLSFEGETLVVTPAVDAAFTDPSGQPHTCTVETDPLVNRPIGRRCGKLGAGGYDLSIDLRGGSDSLVVEPSDVIASATVLGGAGDDSLLVDAQGPRTLRGGDGDDVLNAPASSPSPVTFDGGAGRDLVDYASVRASPDRTPGGVRASLADQTATVVVDRAIPGGLPERTRSDSLIGIERLSGTPQGDILSGGPGDDELQGAGGPDNLFGLAGNDVLGGGDGEDLLDGSKGADTLDGGAGADQFTSGGGGDTLLSRDGVAESLTCVSADVVVDDLVDRLVAPEKCLSVATAQAKHRHDTSLAHRALSVGASGRLRVRVACPAAKAGPCAGVLRLRRGGPRGRVLARVRYSLDPGDRTRVALRVGPRRAALLRGRRATLEAREVDADGRPREILARVRVRKAAGRPR
jgi:RTX calcium-binding nonapeptide repeat (4 copies)